MASLFFSVRSSSTDEIYRIVAARRGERLVISCTCPAGVAHTYCKHRLSLLAGTGYAAALASGNTTDVELLRQILAGSELELRLKELGAAERAADKAKDALTAARKAVAKAMTE